MPLDKSAIIGARDITTRTVDVPEWGGAVIVRVFDGRARDEVDAFVARSVDKSGNLVNPSGMRVLVCRLALCDESGAPLFTPADEAALHGKSGLALDRVFKAAAEINGLSDSGVEAARKTF